MRQMCVLLMVLGVLLCGVVQAELLNPSFEDPVGGDTDIFDWYDSIAYTYTTIEDGTEIPLTPYGVNWAEMGNERWMYQQIGTYGEGMNIDITFLLGQRNSKLFQGVHVSLLVGGDPDLATDVNLKYYTENPLVTQVGAVEIANSGVINPFATADMGTSEQALSLSTGTGYTVGDPLWIQFNKVAGTGRILVDNVAVSNPTLPTLVSPTDGQENLPVTTDALPEETNTTLVWSAPTAYENAEFDVFFGTTEPNYLLADYGLTQLNTGGTITDTAIDPSPSADLDYSTPYYWVVDSYEPNETPPNDPTLYRGAAWSFTTISEVPVIATQPVSATIQPGETTTDLTIDAISTDVYEWFRVGAPDVSVQTTGTYGTPLGSDTYSPDTEGDYYCVVENASFQGENGTQSDTVHVMTPRLVVYWDFDGNLVDEITGTYTGNYVDPNELNPVPTETYTAVDDPNNLGAGNRAFIFDGDNNGGVHIQIDGDPNDFNFYPQGYTVSAWMRTSAGGYGCPVGKQALDKQTGFLLNHNGGTAIHTLRPSSVTEAASMNNDQWRMITGTYDAATKTLTLFVDGVAIDSGVASSVPLTNDARITIGAGLEDGTSAAFTGYVDEVRLWNYPRTPEEIAWDYNDLREAAGGEVPCLDAVGLEYDVAGGPLDGEGNPTPDCRVSLADFVEIIASNWLNCRLASADCITDPGT